MTDVEQEQKLLIEYFEFPIHNGNENNWNLLKDHIMTDKDAGYFEFVPDNDDDRDDELRDVVYDIFTDYVKLDIDGLRNDERFKQLANEMSELRQIKTT
jgi:hypothetical protein